VTEAFRPEATAVQLNLLGSHDTARYLTVAGRDKASLRLATIVQMTVPGAPCIYYGDEVGVEGRHDPDCRRSFPWREEDWDKDLRAFIKAAAALRHEWPTLRRGAFRILAADGNAMAYARTSAGADPIVVALNAGTDAAALSFDLPVAGVTRLVPAAPLLASSASVSIDPAEGVTIELGPRSGAVFIGNSE
jgi:glycosidase